ncbi:MAG: plasmid segregation protein ParM [Candidatus Symbiothrix sp.]|jgi:hypothetical protein|nr:plasmid segregation protein ParM [Candidatus Symbiothrix sp.]
MKKIITLSIALFLFVTSTVAQSFAFFRGEERLENNAEITITKAGHDDLDVFVMESELQVKNLIGFSVQTRMTQRVLTAPNAGILSFCYNVCITGNEDNAQEATLGGNSFKEGFHLSFEPVENTYTIAKAKYEIVNQNNESDKATVTVTYQYDENSTALKNIDPAGKVVLSQNDGEVSLNYNFDNAANRKVNVHSLIGTKTAVFNLSEVAGTVQLPTAQKGIFIYSITENDQIIQTGKYIVR